MIKAPLPFNEKQRQQALLLTSILDTPEEDSYNDFACLAAIICQTHSAAISFIDKDRQWFKAVKNIPVNDVSRDNSFCGHAILQNDILIINDPLKDNRFFDNPYVTGEAGVRFYAGMPIITKEGFKIGTVCVMDDKEGNTLDEKQIEGLKLIAGLIAEKLSFRISSNELAQQSVNVIDAEKKIARLNFINNENKNNRIAYELHENIAQIIAAVRMKIEVLKESLPFKSPELDKVLEYLNQTLADVVSLSNSVTPTTFKNADYLDYILRMITNYKKSHTAKLDFNVDGNAVPFTSIIGLAFYRIIQYQLNLATLCEASELSFNVINIEELILEFEHNGTNENADSTEADLYINNINTQAELMNATFTIDIDNKKMKVVYQTT